MGNTREQEIQEAVDAAINDQGVRAKALDMAVKAIRKMQYGNPGVEASVRLAEAFYKFLKG